MDGIPRKGKITFFCCSLLLSYSLLPTINGGFSNLIHSFVLHQSYYNVYVKYAYRCEVWHFFAFNNYFALHFHFPSATTSVLYLTLSSPKPDTIVSCLKHLKVSCLVSCPTICPFWKTFLTLPLSNLFKNADLIISVYSSKAFSDSSDTV